MRTWRMGLFVAWLVTAPLSAGAHEVSWRGVGPVRLGMTVAQAERALKAKLGPIAPPFTKDCYITGRKDSREKALSYVIVDGRIVVMTVFLRDYSKPNPLVVDINGIGVGATEAEIRRSYPHVRKELSPDFRGISAEEAEEFARERAKQGITEPEPPPHYWMIAESPDRKRAIVFETEAGKVLHFSIGLKPEAVMNEHCI
ncbi:hypothetical protein LQG66_08880 [Bradyrhizobium ontarionense]|uniref:PepSY domain-containing protein n=1 Tax=Bradyrhizobium ontarionense TaxID=2898149 RepID=A0ABY3RHF7_9BRAD|nr:hypothetical protein [Bradyrhizobium sp. A19]UFZ06390.1 hypothetical protein LQG66_08880 [Bradyrhizobium sp. A19]